MWRKFMAAISLAVRWTLLLFALIVVHEIARPLTAVAQGQVPAALRDRASRNGHVRVIVQLNPQTGPHVAEGKIQNPAAVRSQRDAIVAAAGRVISHLPLGSRSVTRRFDAVPYIALDLDLAGLEALETASPDIVSVVEDTILHPVLADSVPLVQGDQAWAAGVDGAGTSIAVIDTGVDATHPFLAGKVVDEACFSSNVDGVSQSFCPNGQSQQIGPGAAAPCPLDDCIHGTHVAGIAAGNGATAGQSFSGVAKGAKIMAVQVFSQVIDATQCPNGTEPCAGAFTSDLIAALDYVYSLAPQRNFAAVNMSLGGGSFTAPCDDQPFKPSIDNLRAAGIPTVVAAGNDYSRNALSAPACVSSAVSVGSVDKSDQFSFFSNAASFLSLVAPGESINSSIPGGGYEQLSGTSMATPHVAGAWGIIHQAAPSASVDAVLAALRQTGKPIVDNRIFIGSGLTFPRIQIFQALASLAAVTNPVPVATSLSPARAHAGVSSLTLTVNGSGFDAFSVVRWNGSNRPTTVTNTHTLTATIPASDLTSGGTAQVSVLTPAPGGGLSAPLTLPIDPPAVLTTSASIVAPGESETTTLTNGFGGSQDWIALAAVGSANTSYLQWTYVGSGVTSRTWTIAMPTTAGQYEFRLFLNNGYTRVATSAPVTVDASRNPAPVATSLSPNRASAGGAAFTLTVTGSSFVASSLVAWNGSNRPTTFVSATQLQAAIAASDIAAGGSATVTVVTPGPGGGTSAPLAFSIVAAPALSVNVTSAAGGAPVTVTLTNGAGGAQDWLALAATTAANTSYIQWVYVGAGVTTRTWTVNMPTTGGTFEFRLFLNNGYTRAATSPPVTVAANTPSLAVSTTTAVTGAPVTVTLTNGLGGAKDWIALASTSSPNTTNVQWIYVGAGVLNRTWTVNMPTVPGTYEFRLFLNDGYTRAATSPTITVQSAGPPTLTISASTTTPGAPVTVTLTNGLGGAQDWIALAATTAANTSYLQWTYVGSGVASRTWTVNMPATPGTYEFRLFLNNGYTRAATSPPVTVIAP